jgi:hypothetical protein
MLLAGLFIALLTPGLAEASASDAWILRCRIDSTTQAERTFRVAPRLLQEWKPADKQYGPNLCEVFSCTADRDRLEGIMTSASLILTLRVDQKSGRGSWKTVGASGLKETNGPCGVEREKPGQKPAAP